MLTNVRLVNSRAMERSDLEQWRPRDVARLLALVETQRRYYQEIVATIPVGVLVVSRELDVILANAALRRIFGLRTTASGTLNLGTLLPAWVLDRIREVFKTGHEETNL